MPAMSYALARSNTFKYHVSCITIEQREKEIRNKKHFMRKLFIFRKRTKTKM